MLNRTALETAGGTQCDTADTDSSPIFITVATMKLFFSLCVSLVVALAVSGDSKRISLKQKSSGERTFVDSEGREVIFHGVNAIVKGPPWIPSTDVWDGETSLSDKDLDDLKSLGLNVIRLGTTLSDMHCSTIYLFIFCSLYTFVQAPCGLVLSLHKASSAMPTLRS